MTFSRAQLSSTLTENAWLHKTKLEKCDVIKRCIVKSHKVSFRETNVGTLYRCKMSDKLWNYGWEDHNNKLYLLNVNLDFGVHQSSFKKSLSSYIASNEVYLLLYCTCKNAQVVTNLQQTCGSAVPTTCQHDVFALLVLSLLTSFQRLIDNLLQGCWLDWLVVTDLQTSWNKVVVKPISTEDVFALLVPSCCDKFGTSVVLTLLQGWWW
jgi:hypothetical protein